MKKRATIHLLRGSNSIWCFVAPEDVVRSTRDPREATCARCLKSFDKAAETSPPNEPPT